MSKLRKILYEVLGCTIVAAVITLLTYLVFGIDKTVTEAVTTFLIAFSVMFITGIYYNRKRKDK